MTNLEQLTFLNKFLTINKFPKQVI